MIPTPPDPFDEWLHAPLGAVAGDPRFEVRRARPEEFERVYDVVDSAFGKKRPRGLFDWMYRKNPYGRARCWVVVENQTGQWVKTGAGFPWPIWRGNEPQLGTLAGDSCTVREWQRRGLAAVRRRYTLAHPWNNRFVGFAGPNEGSRIVGRKAGNSRKQLGALRGGVAPIDACGLLDRVGTPALFSRTAGTFANAVVRSWQRSMLGQGEPSRDRVERIDRFTRDFDSVTERCMSWPLFWSPHNADFLNWRYLDHPVVEYVAVALVENERPTAHAVLALEGNKATLAEFAVDAFPDARALKLMSSVFEIAREAGCDSVNFFGTQTWRHWPFFRRVGFLPYRSKNHLEAIGLSHEPEVLDARNWQLTPGDRDYR